MLCAHGSFYIFKWFYQNVWFRLVLWAHNIGVFNLNVILIQLIFRSSSWIPLHVHDGCVGGKGGDCWRHSTDQVLLSLSIDISTFNWETKLNVFFVLTVFCHFLWLHPQHVSPLQAIFSCTGSEQAIQGLLAYFGNQLEHRICFILSTAI